MKKILTIFFFFLFILQSFSVAQLRKQIDSLTILSNKVTSDSEKVIALGKLADIYYTFQLNRQGDSVLQEQLRIADMSDNNNLILSALFGPALTNISIYATTESFVKTMAFLQKGIDFAKSQNHNNYIALGYTRMADILLKRKQNDKALYNATQALQILPNVNSDSIKAVIYINLGKSYLAKSEAVSAVRNYNNAFDIAVKIKSIPLQSTIYHCFSEMYFVFLDNKDVAKEFVKKSLKLNKEHNYVEGQIWDYYDLSRITDERSYLEKAIVLSDSFHVNKYILQAKILMLYYYFIVDKNSEKSLAYLEKEPEVKESYINPGIGNYYQLIGRIYFYADKFDSALYNYKLAEYDFVKNFDENRTRGLFREIANTYQNLHDLPSATVYYLRALTISKKTNDAKSIASVSNSLSGLYEQQGDYKQAFAYSKQAKKYNDSLAELSKARDLALLDVERENRKHAEELRQEQQKKTNKRNIQYMAITIAIGVIFGIMLIIGMFPVSKLTIKILGYISFISLFEFIVLLIDTVLHKLTHGEPLKIWLIKIVLIAMLVPIQHFLEHRLIKYLESRKLMKARTKFTIKNLFQKTKKPAPVKKSHFEEGTAVL
jgi:tetratricopeptide (TPR) repeat protein